jgi:diguanylate cyclase (GGDEF)-like protein/PAS domain S-box-containing protein
VFESTIEGIMVTDPSGKIFSVNAAFTKITGFSALEAIGQTPRILRSNRHPDDFFREIWEALTVKGMWQGELWNQRKSGDVYPQWTAISAIKDNDGTVKAYVAAFNDISELKRAQDKVEHQALHDPLTGLPNRALFNDRLDWALKSAARGSKQIALLYLDLDRFKNINDSLGHTIGDHLLRDVADRLTARIRSSDTVARLGGDEFVILLEAVRQPTEVASAAKRVLGAFHEPFAIEGHEFFITASLGISVFPGDGEGSMELIRSADLAMYHAKKLGGDGFQFFSREMHDHVIHRVRLENHLRRALDLRQLRICYQPLVEASTGDVFGAEALLRWDHPELGSVPPSEFIPLAEETGLIIPVGAWVLERACQQTKAWQDGGIKDVYASVNVSANQLTDNSFLDHVRRVIADNEISGEALTLEITENTLMKASHQAIHMLRNLKDVGIQIAIDDFGTGYSSLSYLKRFPIDTLKIDRSFIVDLPGHKESIAITRSIIALAKNLSLHVLAEGVETRAQLEFLAAAGCDKIQGYYFSRPVAAEQMALNYPLH